MNTAIKAAAIIAFGAFGLWAHFALQASGRQDVANDPAAMGFREVRVEDSPAAWVCAKGRHVYRYRATLQGRPASGHACAGGLLGVAINPDRN